MPDEAELYLIAFMDDASGIDLAELCWHDEAERDRCFRVRDYQWNWWLCDDTYQADRAGRNLGKTYSILARAFAHAFKHPGADMLITAPELNHLRPLTDAIESRLLSCRLSREMLPMTKGHGIARQPHWQARFLNGAKIVSRLPNKDGRGVKGQHARVVEMDEVQDYPEAGWTELTECLNRGEEGAVWRIHGVTRGVRDRYFDITEGHDPKNYWTIHRKTAQCRDTWGDEERQEKIVAYGGSEDAPDYKRNIFGEPGDASSPMFVLSRLMDRVDTDEGSEYNTDEYTCLKIDYESLNRQGVPIESLLSVIPGSHVASHRAFWGGMDVGFTNDPSEITVFGQPEERKEEHIRLLLRIQLKRISALDQERVIREVFRIYGPKLKRFAMDKSGNGLPIYQHLKDDPQVPQSIRDRMIGYAFSGNYAVEFDEQTDDEDPNVIEKKIVPYASDKLREYVDAKKITLPWDREVIGQLQGQTKTAVRGGRVSYSGGSGNDHIVDAMRMMIAGKTLEAIEAALAQTETWKPVLDRFGA
jgi:hypothetical protein